MADHSKHTGVARALKAGTALLVLGLSLSACAEGEGFSLGNTFNSEKPEAAAAPATTKLVERDVEAPEVFAVSEAGLWDGRPSLGGVWAAHPDVGAPERVIIRNQANGKFVIGALFRRERDIPGPRIQISSDAAEALGMLAGQPVELNVTALRREEVAPEPEVTEVEAGADVAEVDEAPLEPIAAATAAIAAAEADAATAAAPAPTPAAQSEVAPTPTTSSLAKPYVQIGIFSVEANAKNAAKQMETAGLPALIKKTTSGSKTFWRVIVGPASSKSDLKSMIKKVHGTGFTDAYAVTN